MVEFTAVVSYRDGKSESVKVGAQESSRLLGLRIGDTLDGAVIGKKDYSMTIVGGSDSAGFPMRRHIQGGGLVRILFRDRKGINHKVLRRGSVITESIAQVNLVAKKKE